MAYANLMIAIGNFVNDGDKSINANGSIITDSANIRLYIDLNKKSPQNELRTQINLI